MFSKFSWQDGLKIVIALSASGFAFSAENKAGFISLIAMAAVWAIGFAVHQYGWKPNRVHLTGLLFAVSVALTLLFQPVVFPALPVWDGDLALYVSAMLVWAGAVVAVGNQVFIWATVNYNLLLGKVLKKLEPEQTA